MTTGSPQISSILSITSELRERRSSSPTPADAMSERASKRAKEAEVRGQDTSNPLETLLAKIKNEESSSINIRV